MEDLLEKYEKLYFSALEEALEQRKSDPVPILRTLKTISRIHTILLERLQLGLALVEAASSTLSESPTKPSNEPTIEEIRQLMRATKDAARGLRGPAHAETLATGWVSLYERVKET